jgi:hypothetical protein
MEAMAGIMLLLAQHTEVAEEAGLVLVNTLRQTTLMEEQDKRVAEMAVIEEYIQVLVQILVLQTVVAVAVARHTKVITSLVVAVALEL